MEREPYATSEQDVKRLQDMIEQADFNNEAMAELLKGFVSITVKCIEKIEQLNTANTKLKRRVEDLEDSVHAIRNIRF